MEGLYQLSIRGYLPVTIVRLLWKHLEIFLRENITLILVWKLRIIKWNADGPSLRSVSLSLCVSPGTRAFPNVSVVIPSCGITLLQCCGVQIPKAYTSLTIVLNPVVECTQVVTYSVVLCVRVVRGWGYIFLMLKWVRHSSRKDLQYHAVQIHFRCNRTELQHKQLKQKSQVVLVS